MAPSPSRLVGGRYRLRAPLGSGGMGTVWRATDEVLGREVAVKELTFPHGLSDAERDVLRERTRREARAAARLDHPSAVTVYDVVEDGGAPYLVLELVEGRTLADVVRTDGPLTPQRAAQVGLALLDALDAAHAQGIVHRDVKPSNVLVRDDGRVVLTDFGIASATGDPSITSTGMLLGSPAYIAPERARGEAPAPASDLWSLGATLFTAVEGVPPYDGGEPILTVTAVVTGEHAPYVAAGPLVPLLDGLLEKDPSRRLDAAAARPLLRSVAERPAAGPTRVLTTPVPSAGDASRTSALPLGRVREAAAAPAAAASGERSRAPALLAVGGLALLLVAGGAVALSTGAGDDPGRSAAPAASAPADDAPTEDAPSEDAEAPPPAASPEAEPDEPEAPEGDGGREVPEGWTTDTGGAGWTVALPPGYAQTRPGEYRGPNGRTLRIDTTGPGGGKDDAVADRQEQAASFEDRYPSYEEIRIEPVDYRGYEAADWEFTYEGLHVLNRVFVVDGRGHSIFLQGPQGDRAAVAEDFAGITRAFTAVGEG